MTLSKAMRISSTGMHAERFRMDIISGNIANANTVSEPGKPAVRRQTVVLRGNDDGVKVDRIAPDMAQPRKEFQPDHPLADKDGFVTYTNINPVFEMVDMITASRAYEANLAAFNAAKSMTNAALTIGKSA